MNGSDYFARLFSIVCCLGTLAVAWRFGKRYLPALPDWLAPFVIAINPFFMWIALDIRVYALIALLSAALTLAFFAAFLDDDPKPVALAGFTVLSIGAVYTQYFLGFMFVGFTIALLASNRRRRLVRFLVAMTVVALTLMPLVIGNVSRQFQNATIDHYVSGIDSAKSMFSTVLLFAFPHVNALTLPSDILYVTLLLCFAVYLVPGRPLSDTSRALCAIWIGVVALFLITILGLEASLEMPRHVTVLFVPTNFVILALLSQTTSERRRFIICVTYACTLVLLSAIRDFSIYHVPISNTGDWQRVGAYLNAHVKRSEPIAVYDPEYELAVRHYYRGTSPIEAIPSAQSFELFDRRAFGVSSEAQLEKAFPRVASRNGSVWFVYGVTACTMKDVDRSCTLINDFIARRFRVSAVAHFNGTSVLKLNEKS